MHHSWTQTAVESVFIVHLKSLISFLSLLPRSLSVCFSDSLFTLSLFLSLAVFLSLSSSIHLSCKQICECVAVLISAEHC